MNATHWISIAQALATAFVGIVAVFITYRMQSKQIDIEKGVKEIVRAQHETAATKLRLELFEKRYGAYKEVLSCIDAYILYGPETTAEEYKIMKIRWSAACIPFKFLFDESIHLHVSFTLGNAIVDHAALLDALERHKDHAADLAETKTKFTENFNALKDAIREFDKKVKPFLSI